MLGAATQFVFHCTPDDNPQSNAGSEGAWARLLALAPSRRIGQARRRTRIVGRTFSRRAVRAPSCSLPCPLGSKLLGDTQMGLELQYRAAASGGLKQRVSNSLPPGEAQCQRYAPEKSAHRQEWL